MPTQEERLTALEQTFATFQKEIASHIQATDENTTIMLGVIRHQGQDIKRIVQRLETIDQRLNTIEQRLDQLETKVEQRLDRLETKSNEHTELLHQILARMPKTP